MIKVIRKPTLSINFDNFCKVILLLYICVLYAFYDIRLIAEAVTLSVLFIYFIIRKKKLTLYFLWNILFVGFCFLSLLWTVTPNDSYKAVRAVLEIAIIGNLFISYIDTKEKLVYLYKCFVIAGFTLISKLLITFPISMWGNERLGDGVYNANTIGLSIAIAGICAMQLANISSQKIYYMFIAVFFLVTVLTGSRKAFLFFVVGLALLYLLNSRNMSKKLLAIPVGVLIIFLGYKLVMNIPELYSVLGVRLEGMFNAITGGGTVDNSTNIRIEMTQTGIYLFKNRPLIGYGISSYTNIAGFGMYAHNNYIELLVGVGILGTSIYYSIYLYSIINLFLLRNKVIGNGILVIIVILAVVEYGFVSYYGELYHILIASAIAVVQVMRNEKREIMKKQEMRKY